MPEHGGGNAASGRPLLLQWFRRSLQQLLLLSRGRLSAAALLGRMRILILHGSFRSEFWETCSWLRVSADFSHLLAHLWRFPGLVTAAIPQPSPKFWPPFWWLPPFLCPCPLHRAMTVASTLYMLGGETAPKSDPWAEEDPHSVEVSVFDSCALPAFTPVWLF